MQKLQKYYFPLALNYICINTFLMVFNIEFTLIVQAAQCTPKNRGVM